MAGVITTPRIKIEPDTQYKWHSEWQPVSLCWTSLCWRYRVSTWHHNYFSKQFSADCHLEDWRWAGCHSIRKYFLYFVEVAFRGLDVIVIETPPFLKSQIENFDNVGTFWETNECVIGRSNLKVRAIHFERKWTESVTQSGESDDGCVGEHANSWRKKMRALPVGGLDQVRAKIIQHVLAKSFTFTATLIQADLYWRRHWKKLQGHRLFSASHKKETI